MGILDNLRGAAEQFNAQQQAQSDQTVAAALPPGTVLPQRVQVRPSARFTHSTLQAFFAVVGLAPEDCYGITAQRSNDIAVSWEVYFRHRPEHDAGLAKWAELEG